MVAASTDSRSDRRAARQRGTVTLVCLVLVAGVGAALTTFLGRAVTEQHRVLQKAAVEHAAWRAIGQIELAKNVIKNSAYTAGENDAIFYAIKSATPLIAGTPVVIERVGSGAHWYRMTTSCDFGPATSMAQCLVRDGTPSVAYNYYVENQSLGISGKPKGRIHTNKSLELYFSGGAYDGMVTAGDGFTFKNGATKDNTTFLGGTDPKCPPKSLLSTVDYATLKAQAAYVAPAGLVADVKLTMGVATPAKKGVAAKPAVPTAIISLYTKDTTVQVPVTKTKQVQTGTQLQAVTHTKYKLVWQWVNVTTTSKVWVDTSNNGATGTDVAGGGATGYWKTVTTTSKVYKQVSVADGTYTTTELVPVYQTVTYTDYVTQTVAGKLQQTVSVPDTGILYFQDGVRGISGDVGSHTTIVSEASVKITGNLRYKDKNGQTAYLNGDNPAGGDYVPNPNYAPDQTFGIIAKGNILYSRDAPANLEINGSYISTGGMVAMDGVVLDAKGVATLSGTAKIKGSLRRFGSIMCWNRPVSTLLDASGVVMHGFASGTSIYDRCMLNSPPPGFPSEETPMFLETVRIDPGNHEAPGLSTFASGVKALTGMRTADSLKDLARRQVFNWGAVR